MFIQKCIQKRLMTTVGVHILNRVRIELPKHPHFYTARLKAEPRAPTYSRAPQWDKHKAIADNGVTDAMYPPENSISIHRVLFFLVTLSISSFACVCLCDIQCSFVWSYLSACYYACVFLLIRESLWRIDSPHEIDWQR